jgi:hypothetical protein
MSFLFEKRTKKAARVIWSVLGVLIIISMALFFAPGLIPGVGFSGF